MSKQQNIMPMETAITAAARQVGTLERDPDLLKLEETARAAGRRVACIRAEIEGKRRTLADLDAREADARNVLNRYERWVDDRAAAEARAMIGSDPLIDGGAPAADDGATWEAKRVEAVRVLGATEAGRGIINAEVEGLERRLVDAVEEHADRVRHAAQRRVNVSAQVYAVLVDLLRLPLADATGAEDMNRRLRRDAGHQDERLDGWGSVLLRALADGGPEVLDGRSLRRPAWLTRYGSELPGRDRRAAEILADLSGGGA
ncbi:hypothetical protein ACM64Y_01670 [Novispirillum sp. DQ9]|uniref:hypothetical protein n=1 Tax=Novispirillum sp. DQ9 TaxID=3398612 RepID=UPI003C7B279B